MGDLVHGTNRAEMSHANAPDLGRSRSVDDDVWSGAALSFNDVASGVAPLLSPLVAEAAAVERKIRRRKKGDYVRRRWAWRADRTGFIVIRQEQTLRPLPDGRFKPDGSWRTTQNRRFEAAQVRRRVGDVACDADTSAVPGSGSAPGSNTAPRIDGDLEYLPTSVRRSYALTVPSPEFEAAEALRWSSEGRVARHTVAALRLGPRIAVVVQASRQAGATSWQVEQVTYESPLASTSTRQGAPPETEQVGRS